MGREKDSRRHGHRAHAERIDIFVGEVNRGKQEGTLKTIDPYEHTHGKDQSIEVIKQDAAKEVKLRETTPCQTQPPLPTVLTKVDPKAGVLDAYVGLFGTIPRWVKGSVINFAAYAGGYPAAGDAVFAAQQLNKAALYWNSLDVGVTFKWVGTLADAEFVLGYAGDQGNLVARAFFPNGNDLNNLTVYKRAFDSDLKPVMWRYFLHELGHVLGLRHEFAMDTKYGEDPSKPLELKEDGAILIGARDLLSVMNYRPEAPMITQDDIKYTKIFYDFNGPSIQGVPMQLFVPDN